jgi:hypothetical protein
VLWFFLVWGLLVGVVWGGLMGSGVGVDVGEEGDMMGVSLMGGTEV